MQKKLMMEKTGTFQKSENGITEGSTRIEKYGAV